MLPAESAKPETKTDIEFWEGGTTSVTPKRAMNEVEDKNSTTAGESLISTIGITLVSKSPSVSITKPKTSPIVAKDESWGLFEVRVVEEITDAE